MESLKSQLDKAKLELTQAQNVQNARNADVKDTKYGKFDPTSKYGKEALEKLRTAALKTQSAQTKYDKLKLAFDKEQEKKKITGEQEGIPEEKQAASQGLTVDQLRVKKEADLAAEKERKAKEARAAGGPANTGNVPIEDFLKNLDTASTSTINEIKTYLGIKNLNGKLDYETIIAIYAKEKEIETVADATGKPVDRLTYYKSAPKPGGAGVIPTATISSPTSASAIINSVFQSELGRDATASEIQKYTTELNAAERKNPSKTVKGITTGGLNKTEFLTQIVKKLPEYSIKKSDKASITSQSILGTARANGITLGQDQINNFTQQIQNGTDIKIIQNQIRSIASLGMPDNVKKLLNEGVDLETVFSPYKNTMAAILELNPETISLNDPTLRMAMGGDYSKVTSTPGMGGVSRGEYTMYDFEKALRKDYRWQYTDNAKRDVSNVALKVLRDFGFQA
jgi:hypothetical protein